jgi:hypothetical protein
MNKLTNKKNVKDTSNFDDRNVVPVTRAINP